MIGKKFAAVNCPVVAVIALVLVQTVMSLAAPWPLKIVLDSVDHEQLLAHNGIYAELQRIQYEQEAG